MRDPTLKVRSRPSIRGRFSRVAMDKKGQPQPCGRKRTWASLQNIWDDDNDGDLWPYSCKESTKAGLCHFFTFLLLLGSKYSKDERRTSTSREAMRGTSYARATVTRSIHNLLYDKSPYVSLIPD